MHTCVCMCVCVCVCVCVRVCACMYARVYFLTRWTNLIIRVHRVALSLESGWGCSSSFAGASARHAADAGSIPRCGKGFFSQSQLSVQTLLRVSVHPCVCDISAHVKELVVHARVWWITETLKHPTCTVDWVARLCRSWLSTWKATRISFWRNPIGTIQL